jgi:hypothetical protein
VPNIGGVAKADGNLHGDCNCKEITRILHRLKGASRVVGVS